MQRKRDVCTLRTCDSSSAFDLIPASQDESRRVHPGEVLGRLEAEPCVGANDDDSLAREIGGFDGWYGGELATEGLSDAEFHADVGKRCM